MDIETFFRDHAPREVLFMRNSRNEKDDDLSKFLDDMSARNNVNVNKKPLQHYYWEYRNTYKFIFKVKFDGTIIVLSNSMTEDREFISGFGKKLAIRRLRI
jgi:hypothetical protein